MVFNIEELPKNKFEKFIEFLGKGKTFDEVRKYYKENNLSTFSSGPCIYKFTGLNGKIYYGKADDLFQRLYNYVSDKGYITQELRDHFYKYGYNFFTYSIATEFNGVKITLDNILDAENFYTSRANSFGIQLYNKTNKKLKLEIRTAKPAKNLKSKYKKIDKNDPDKYSGFGDIFGL